MNILYVSSNEHIPVVFLISLRYPSSPSSMAAMSAFAWSYSASTTGEREKRVRIMRVWWRYIMWTKYMNWQHICVYTESKVTCISLIIVYAADIYQYNYIIILWYTLSVLHIHTSRFGFDGPAGPGLLLVEHAPEVGQQPGHICGREANSRRMEHTSGTGGGRYKLIVIYTCNLAWLTIQYT